MTSTDFHMIQVKGTPLKVILLMIKMQFEEHIFLKVHSNLIHMFFQNERLQQEIVNSILYGFKIMTGLNIVSKRILCFALYATCSRRVLGQIHLLLMAGEIKI